LVHKWRSEEQAILVGTNTVIEDNPSLTTRDWSGNHPIRIVLDQNNRISKESYIFDNQVKSITITKENINFNNNIALEITDFLYNEGIQSVIIEGGRQTLQTFIEANIWDEARVFRGEIYFKSGTKAPTISGENSKKEKILNDELLTFFNYD
jgi:diaminohydroxyphosphoribosylaminopyrimidine deaminase/5-amino-6-(5-phosphoribosylamino)uracil reductase